MWSDNAKALNNSNNKKEKKDDMREKIQSGYVHLYGLNVLESCVCVRER